MEPQAIFRAIQRQPFRPFRLYLLEKTTFEVRHPEVLIVDGINLELYNPAHTELEPSAIIDLMLVSRMEPIVPPVSPLVNGA